MLTREIQLLEEYGDVLTVSDVCKILRIGKNTAYKLLQSNTIQNFKIGSVRKIPKKCLLEYIDRVTQKGNTDT